MNIQPHRLVVVSSIDSIVELLLNSNSSLDWCQGIFLVNLFLELHSFIDLSLILLNFNKKLKFLSISK